MTTFKKQNLTLFLTLSPNQKKGNSSSPLNFPHQLYQNLKSDPKSTIAIVKCKSIPKNVAANVDLSSKKPLTAAGLCPSLKTLDKRLDEAFDSPEATRAFEILRTKMEKDKQLKKTRENHMYFDATDNYISAEDIRSKYKKICKSKEYLEAKKSLLK
jgi:hypothetical protein